MPPKIGPPTSPTIALLSELLELSVHDLKEKFSSVIPLSRCAELHHITAGLDLDWQRIAYMLSFLSWTLSNSRCILPRDYQLYSAMATIVQSDSLLVSATGSGKTLTMVLPMLYCNDRRFLVISPLKRLQHAQVFRFIFMVSFTSEPNLNERFDSSLNATARDCRIAREFHGSMSTPYLAETMKSFESAEPSSCMILVATKGASLV